MSIRTYRWNQTPLVGLRSLVISQLHTWEGASARSSGLTLVGWVAWARRSRVCPAAAAMRYMLDREHQYRPSSSSRTHARSKDRRYQRYSARPGRPPSQLGSTPEWAPCARTAVSVGDAPPVAATGGSGWPEHDRSECTPSWSPPRPPAGRRTPRS